MTIETTKNPGLVRDGGALEKIVTILEELNVGTPTYRESAISRGAKPGVAHAKLSDSATLHLVHVQFSGQPDRL